MDYSHASQSCLSHSFDSTLPLFRLKSTFKDNETSSIRSKVPETPITQEKKKTIPVSRNARWLALLSIIGGWVLAASLAVIHHTFLSNIDGEVVNREGMMTIGSQFWIKTASTAFVRAVVLPLTVSATATLTQLKWRSSLNRAMRIGDIDYVFKLPSMKSLLSLLFSSLAPLLALTLALVIAIQGLELVTILGPNALKIVPNPGGRRLLKIPSLDLSRGNLTSVDELTSQYEQPSAFWTRLVQKIVMFPQGVALTAPPECVSGCSYNFTYRAPALNCRDLAVDEISLNSNTSITTVYNATTSLLNTTLINDGYWIDYINPPYDLRIEWQALTTDHHSNAWTGDRGGAYCLFHDATYMVSANFSGTSQALGFQVVRVGDVLVGNYGGTNATDVDSSLGQTATTMSFNFRATCDAFARSLSGVMEWDSDGGERLLGGVFEPSKGSPQLAPLFNLIDNHDTEVSQWKFEPATYNLSDSLMSIFTNVTLGILIARDDFAEVEAFVYTGQVEWSYNPVVLWATYAPALAIFFLFGCHGVFCVLQGDTRDSYFSTLVVATRDEGIDRACAKVAELDELREVKVRYKREGVFVVDL